MAAYLSKIAARFNGSSSVAASSEPAGPPTMMPNQPRFAASELGDNGTSFFETTSPWTEGEGSVESPTQAEPSTLQPASNESIPYFESVHTLVHRDVLKKELHTQHTNQQFIETKVQKGMIGENLPLASNAAMMPSTRTATDIQQSDIKAAKEKNLSPATPDPLFERPNPIEPTLNPVTNSHEVNPVTPNAPAPLALPTLAPQKEKVFREEEVILQKQTTELPAAEAPLNTRRPARLLRPRPPKQAALPTPKATAKNEAVLRIGSIKVEILPPAPPAVRTIPRQPQRPTATKPIPSVNKPRFPQRFGLGQM